MRSSVNFSDLRDQFSSQFQLSVCWEGNSSRYNKRLWIMGSW